MKSNILLLLCFLTLTACKKKINQEPTPVIPINKTVYTVGLENNGTYNVAKLWKNGVATTLGTGTSNSRASAIYVSGDDIYVCGYELNGAISVAKLWKNGVSTSLSDGTLQATANDIFVIGTTVFVAGIENNKAKLWRNGIDEPLTIGTRSSAALSVYSSGGQLYVSGYEDLGTGWFNAAMWKNGKATYFSKTDRFSHSVARSVFVNDDGRYIAGYEGNNTMQIAKIWKDDVATNLTNGTKSADISSIFVKGTDVYTCGYEYGTKPMAKYWKNGVATNLSDDTKNEVAKKIFVIDNDIYVAGFENDGTKSRAKLWKNGVAQFITDGTKDAELTGIFVK